MIETVGDEDDPPPAPTWVDPFWYVFNRSAEETLRWLRFWGLIR